MNAALSRRDFFTRFGRLVVLVPVGTMVLAGVGCSSDSDSDCATADSVMSTGTALVVTSTCTGDGGGHDHTFTVEDTDLATPPTAGVSGNSSAYDDDGHVHTVALTSDQLTMIQGGTTVSVVSGTTLNHNHTFNFKKA